METLNLRKNLIVTHLGKMKFLWINKFTKDSRDKN